MRIILKSVGYYRVKYDTNSLRQITDQLYRDHTVIDPQTRSALIDDSLNLAYSGMRTNAKFTYNLLEHCNNSGIITNRSALKNSFCRIY